MTKTQERIIAIADSAKANGEDPITTVQKYFDEKDSHFPRARIVIILAAAREAARKEGDPSITLRKI
jgi:hypothetical protein